MTNYRETRKEFNQKYIGALLVKQALLNGDLKITDLIILGKNRLFTDDVLELINLSAKKDYEVCEAMIVKRLDTLYENDLTEDYIKYALELSTDKNKSIKMILNIIKIHYAYLVRSKNISGLREDLNALSDIFIPYVDIVIDYIKNNIGECKQVHHIALNTKLGMGELISVEVLNKEFVKNRIDFNDKYPTITKLKCELMVDKVDLKELFDYGYHHLFDDQIMNIIVQKTKDDVKLCALIIAKQCQLLADKDLLKFYVDRVLQLSKDLEDKKLKVEAMMRTISMNYAFTNKIRPTLIERDSTITQYAPAIDILLQFIRDNYSQDEEYNEFVDRFKSVMNLK